MTCPLALWVHMMHSFRLEESKNFFFWMICLRPHLVMNVKKTDFKQKVA